MLAGLKLDLPILCMGAWEVQSEIAMGLCFSIRQKMYSSSAMIYGFIYNDIITVVIVIHGIITAFYTHTRHEYHHTLIFFVTENIQHIKMSPNYSLSDCISSMKGKW